MSDPKGSLSFSRELMSASNSDEEDEMHEQTFLSHEKEEPEDISIEWVRENPDLKNIAQPIQLDRFEQETASRNLQSEFRIMISITETNFHSKKIVNYSAANAKLNRYPTVVPFSFNLPKLDDFQTQLAAGPSPYINASLVRGRTDSHRCSKYIAAQAPMENCLQAFWAMVWKYEVPDIYCLTRTQENGVHKANMYWKNSAPDSAEEFRVAVLSKEEDCFEIKRVLEIKSASLGLSRTCVHHHVTCWDDDSVPSKQANIDDLISMVEDLTVRQSAPDAKPVVVHCSAGIGRTGVFIALAELITQVRALKNKHPQKSLKDICVADPNAAAVSVFEVVRSIREQRWGCVKSFVQYHFIYSATAVYIRKAFAANSTVHPKLKSL